MRKTFGFSLIELMFTLAIIAILILFAYPSYSHYKTRANRQLAEAVLTQLAARLENYYTENNTYEGATVKGMGVHFDANLPYQLMLVNLSEAHFEIKAIPFDQQATEDRQCGVLGLTDRNEKKISGDGSVKECWR